MTARVVNFGCRLNALEGEAVRALVASSTDRETVVVNTCAVTAEATRQARQAIRRLRREHPEARIVATGCAAQVDPAGFAAMAEIDHVAGNAEKLAPSYWGRLETADRIVVSDIMSLRESAAHMVDAMSRTRAFVEVQNGCDHRCTFCIIPYGRGPSRSVPMGRVVDQVARLVDAGHREVVLTGVDLTSYGSDLPGIPRLGDLVGRIMQHVPSLPRLRLSSIDSIEVDEALLDLIASEPRLMPHLHLSLQAGDDMVLKRMKRRHLRREAVEFCARVRARRPDVAFGADLIAGFPTETEAMFERTLALIADCDLTHVHVFPYSARVGTPAARMPQVARPVVKERAARLREAAAEAFGAALYGARGSRVSLLVEDDNRGRTEDFLPARLAGAAVAAGTIMDCVVTGVDDGALLLEGAA